MKNTKKNSLTANEMNQLKGGDSSSSSSGDIRNINGTSTCICKWNDYSTISNENSVSGCQCVCVKREDFK